MQPASTALSSDPKQRIGFLSIDGGGVRGRIPSEVLELLWGDFGKFEFSRVFSYQAATSVSSFIVLGLNVKTIVEINALFDSSADKVFYKPGWITKLFTLDFLLRYEYSVKPFMAMVDGAFGTTPFSAAKAPTFIATTCLTPVDAVPFISSRCPQYPTLTMAQIIRAATAATTYFQPYDLTDKDGVVKTFTDGGLGNNMNTLRAYTEFKDDFEGKDVEILSLGTANCVQNIPLSKCKNWGGIEWADPLITAIFNATCKNQEQTAARLFSNARYIRLQPDVPEDHDALNDGSKANIDYLKDVGKQVYKANYNSLERMMRRILDQETN
jgi:patatin-like phospholipase/acyl hydrolase